MNLCKFSLEPHHCLFNIWLALDLKLHKMEMEEIYQITFIKMWQIWKRGSSILNLTKHNLLLEISAIWICGECTYSFGGFDHWNWKDWNYSIKI